MKKINQKGEFSYNLLMVLVFLIIVIAIAVILFYPKITSNVILSENQGNNQPNYNHNPPIQEDKQPTQQKDWDGIIYDLKTQIKVVALELNIPISKINVFTTSSGEPFRIDIQLKEGWMNNDGDSADLIDIFQTKSYQIIKNLGLFKGEKLWASSDRETEIISFYISER